MTEGEDRPSFLNEDDDILKELRNDPAVQEEVDRIAASLAAREESRGSGDEYLAECLRSKVEVERILASRGKTNPLVGESDAILRIYPDILRVARSSNRTNVFLYGEFGTGKEVLVDLIALLGNTPDQDPQKFDVSANTETLASSAFFGMANRGATGVDRREGHIQLAGAGVLMCDGLEAAPAGFVTRLKRVLSERTYYRDGSTTLERAECRFVCCSNMSLDELILGDREFQNLPSRWPVKIELPNLDMRKDDIPALVRCRIRQRLREEGLSESIADRVYPAWEQIEAWMSRSWSGAEGNVRALFNAVDEYLLRENVRDQLDSSGDGELPVPNAGAPARTGVERESASRVMRQSRGGRPRSVTDDQLVETLQWADDENRAGRFTEERLWRRLRDVAGSRVYSDHDALSQRVRRIRNPELQQRARGLLRYLFGAMA